MLDEEFDHLKFRGTGGEIVSLFAFGSFGVWMSPGLSGLYSSVGRYQ